MHELQVSPKCVDYEAYVKRSALESDYTTLVTEPTVVVFCNRPVIAYLKLDWDFKPLINALNRIEYQKTERTGGLKTTSRVFGYQPRVALRRDFCTATSLAKDDAEANRLICSLGEKIAFEYQRYFPAQYLEHHALSVTKVLPEWRIPNTCFTSGIINKNNPLKYHFDSGNFEGVCSCMLGFKRDIAGGYLSVPELDLGFEISDQSLLIFDGQSLMHGVTPIQRVTPNAYRYTIVYYTLKAMWNCAPLDSELARIRKLKTQREQKRAGLLDEAIVDQHGERK